MTDINSSKLQNTSDRLLRYGGILLVATVWTSAFLFGFYILSFYALAALGSDIAQWNEALPGLYDPEKKAATLGIGLHFLAGGIILVLGCVQLIEGIRLRFPLVHRFLGRVYIVASLFAGFGGLLFIVVKGTIGGLLMDIAFGLYGILMIGAAVQTFRHAVARRLALHRAWAIRLFALAIGSWLYRMDYGFWFLITDGIGHTKDFRGIFDYFMDFWFYLPNLLVAEVFIARHKITHSPIIKIIAALLLFAATLFLILATYYFTKLMWGPGILKGFGL